MSLTPTLTTFRDTIRRISPTWLQGFYGYRFLYSAAVQIDAMADGLTAALKLRFPNLYTNETLPLIGRERGIRRGFDELDESYATRLRGWWDYHKHKGNPYALMREVQAYLGTHAIKMRVVNNAGAWYTKNADGTTEYLAPPTHWNWDGSTADWSRYWLILYPNGLWTHTGAWGAGANWGPTTFGNPTWGSSATREQVQSIQAIVEDMRGPHSTCVNIIIAFDNASFDPTDTAPPLPDGTWGNAYTITAGHAVPSRLSTAIYWQGTL